jgi:hypothetical protein
MEGVSDVVVDLDKQTAQVTTDKLYSVSDYEAALAKTIYRVLDVAEAE